MVLCLYHKSAVRLPLTYSTRSRAGANRHSFYKEEIEDSDPKNIQP